MTDPGDGPQPGGDSARARVQAAVDAPGHSATLRPPALLAARPLRPLPAPLAARLAGRPARLTRTERRAVLRSRSWESRQPWIGPASAGRERALVAVAVQTVERICATGAWGSPHLDGHRTRLDLVGELDQIDAAAFSLATAPQADIRVEQLWLAAVDRVVALDTYATHLAALDRHLAALDHAGRAESRIAELGPGAARAGHATDHLGVLADELRSLSAAVVEVTGIRAGPTP